MALADRARLAELAASVRPDGPRRKPTAIPGRPVRDGPRLPGAETLAFVDIDATRN
jgi:hypothetical protein